MKKPTKRLAEIAVAKEPQKPAVVEHHFPSPTPEYLGRLRREALERQGALNTQARHIGLDIDSTVAELEGWRNEIEATIAFLKATRGR